MKYLTGQDIIAREKVFHRWLDKHINVLYNFRIKLNIRIRDYYYYS